MKETLNIFELIIAVLIVGVIILQNRGASTGMAFGGTGESYRSKRGLEQLLFYVTIILASFFALISILSLLS